MFDLSERDEEKLDAWLIKHKKKCKKPYPFLTYRFTPTGIGTIIKVKCSCGKEIDLTDTSTW